MDEHILSAERFATLAEAYGADLRRWPADLRAAAEAHLAVHPQSRGVLIDAARLDDLLAAYRVASPGAALIGRVLAHAPQSGSSWSRAKLWWSGLGLAGAGLAGGLAGAAALWLATPMLAEHRFADSADSQTVFGDIDLNGAIR
ncbi:hypothetical protein [Sphingomonas sanxanigenens]|uniref:Uncharacterized protein n=1 Tax=Sphingomonas sanxanigenens DSM 19645 = NX02 TaxID=1123269 RepID=W0A6D3_9SPHN|nr:hypothetical protein [Sphingomonas sanxanigenens]AHE53489.1 hypothetical protein NX02_08830 [Sphingomonas sanxanigenens DSM 19645 = NX02]